MRAQRLCAAGAEPPTWGVQIATAKDACLTLCIFPLASGSSTITWPKPTLIIIASAVFESCRLRTDLHAVSSLPLKPSLYPKLLPAFDERLAHPHISVASPFMHSSGQMLLITDPVSTPLSNMSILSVPRIPFEPRPPPGDVACPWMSPLSPIFLSIFSPSSFRSLSSSPCCLSSSISFPPTSGGEGRRTRPIDAR